MKIQNQFAKIAAGILSFFIALIFVVDVFAASCSEIVRCDYQWNYSSTDCTTGNFAYWRECNNKSSPLSCTRRYDGNGNSFRRENAGTETKYWTCGDSYGACYCLGSVAYKTYYRGVCGSSYPSCSSSSSRVRAPECDSRCCSPANGGWSDWGECISGTATRTCTNPAPSCGGSSCVGDSTQICAVKFLRIQTSSGMVDIAAEPAGTLTSPLRVFKNGATFGILLVPITDAHASNVRIQTASGVKALRKF